MTRPTPAAKTLHLVDASLFVFRAWHSMPDQWHDADGWPTDPLHPFNRIRSRADAEAREPQPPKEEP